MPDLRPAIFAVNSTLIVLSLAAISCRIGRKFFLVRSFGWHDALISLAAVCATIFSVLQMASTPLGVGLPVILVSQSEMIPILKLVFASRFFYFVCNWSVKHSLLIFYTELTIDRWPRRCIYLMHAIAFAFGCTCIGSTIFQCTPITKIWHMHVPGHCIDMNAFNYFNSCFMLATDLVLYAMPIAFTWTLQLRLPQRIGVTILFALGGLVLAASAARVYCVNAQATNPDFTYKFAATMLCAVIENHLAIIVACAPSIKVILLLVFPGLLSRFEKLVSKVSPATSLERSSGITVDLEVAFGRKEGQGVDMDVGMEVARPVVERVTTDESRRSKSGRMGTWWRAPSSWDVNVVGRIQPV